jgi:hypothetical protein
MKKTLLLLLALAPFASAADVTGRFAAGTRYQEPDAHAPATISRMYARAVPRSASVDLPATGSSGLLIWTIGPKVRTRLRTPSGAMLQPNDRGSIERGLRRFDEGADEVVHVMNAMPARYQLDVDVPENVDGVTVVAAEPDSALTLSTWAAPLSRQSEQPITLHAELRDGTSPIPNANVTARLTSPDKKSFASITLNDIGNGVYEATLADLPNNASGMWQVRFEADGATAAGTRFARTGSSELVAERPAAHLGRIATEVIGDVLRIRVPADIAIAGNYRFDVQIADHARNALAWGEGPRTLAQGATSLEIDVPLASLNGIAIEDLFIDARLLGMDVMGVAGRVTRE